MAFTDEERRQRKNERQRRYYRENADKAQQYANEYNKTKMKSYAFRLSYKEDRDIIDYLDSLENKTDYIRQLIRDDMENLIL